MPCFYYSPHANASTKPENDPFMGAELGAHVLRMCPLQWQDQYNMNKKGMTPMDMRLLLTLLKAIECICTYEKGKLESSKKSSYKGKKGKKSPGTNSTVRVPKKVCFEKHCNLRKKHVGAYTMHHTHDCHRFEKDGKEKSDFGATKKGGKKGNPVRLSWECRQHVGDTSATCQNVANFWSTCVSVPTQKLPRRKNFVSGITSKL